MLATGEELLEWKEGKGLPARVEAVLATGCAKGREYAYQKGESAVRS